MSKFTISLIGILLYFGLFIYVVLDPQLVEALQTYVERGSVLAPIAYMLLAVFAVVLAPLTIMPIIPAASAVFGSFLAGLYSIIGWGIGSVIAFLIARYLGRPVLKKFISLEKIKEYESYIPKKMEFWAVVLLRMVIPVDALSYALGLLSTIGFWKYTVATFVAISPFAFIFAYAGGALVYRDLTLLISMTALGLVLFGTLAYIFYHHGGLKEKLESKSKNEN